jgi:putative DNA primase/helicase
VTATEERLFFLEPRFGRGEETPFDERFPCTDAGNAEMFAWLHRDLLRYDHRRGRWLEWGGHWWREDTTEQVVQRAVRTARYRFHQSDSIIDAKLRGAVAAWAIKSESRPRLDACLAIARSVWPLDDDGEGWDADPWLLGVENGVLDLRSGQLHDGRREDKVTRHAPVKFDPKAKCPTFNGFLNRVQPDAETRAYLQRRAGYALTGDVGEQDLAFFHGGGANGKTTFANALMDTLGRDYSRQAPPGLLLRHYGDRHPTEIADLDGARLLVSTEVEDGRVLAEELVKQVTGGDRLKARRIRQDFYEFECTFKIVLLANHKPTVKGTDLAIWRRIKLVPWEVTIPAGERDQRLRDKLRREVPGILNWALAGCLDWQKNGMREPPSVSAATESYREESDPLAQFIEDRCVVGEGYWTTSASAFRAYQAWATEQGMSEREGSRLTVTRFGRLMGERFQRARGHGGERGYRGVGLLSERQEPLQGDAFREESPSEGEQDGVPDPETGDAFDPLVTRFESEAPENPVNRHVFASRELNQKNSSNASRRQPEGEGPGTAEGPTWVEELP